MLAVFEVRGHTGTPSSALTDGKQAGLHSNSTRTCPPWTASPTLTLTRAILPASDDVTTVSIFIASRTSNTSLTWMLCPTWAETRTTTPAMGLRHTLLSSVTGTLLGCTGDAGTVFAAGTRVCAAGGT